MKSITGLSNKSKKTLIFRLVRLPLLNKLSKKRIDKIMSIDSILDLDTLEKQTTEMGLAPFDDTITVEKKRQDKLIEEYENL